MNWYVVARMLGRLALLVGGSMVFSLPWAFPFAGQVESFEFDGFFGLLGAMFCSLVLGLALTHWGQKDSSPVLRKEAFATVGLGWMLAGVLGAMPFYFSGTEWIEGQRVTPVDALFESISGFTTTGASLLTELEDPNRVPRCVLFWRSFTHWLGGMGIIVLFVAILGQLGAGGKAMLKREVPGPITESVRPRVQESALIMWAIYVALSVIETILLLLSDVRFFDALCHTFGTMATGGFSTHNRSAGHYGGGVVEIILVVFMILAGVNFSLYYSMFRHHRREVSYRERLSILLKDREFRAYLLILAVSTLLLTFTLVYNNNYPTTLEAFRHSLFASVSITTTTGFGTEDFVQWSEFAKGLLFLLMFVGGCAGSTGGGIKVIRWVLIVKIFSLEIEKAFRPNVVRPLKLGGNVIHEDIRHGVVIYFCMVMLIFMSSWLLLIAIEPDDMWLTEPAKTPEKILDCATAVASTLNNIGPGLGVVGPTQNYSGFSQAGKALLTLLMLLGRLELFAVLILFSPQFWRKQ